jgi:hypothetical protein
MQTIFNYFENNKDIEYVLMFVISKQKKKDHLWTIVQCKRGCHNNTYFDISSNVMHCYT